VSRRGVCSLRALATGPPTPMGAKDPDTLERVSREDIDQAAAAFVPATFAAADGAADFGRVPGLDCRHESEGKTAGEPRRCPSIATRFRS
jgi:hypothetical protein